MSLRGLLRRFRSTEAGSVTVDFVIVLPVILTIMLASFEASYATFRMVMLERALDITVRDLRTGAFGAQPEHDQVRQRFCSLISILPNCEEVLMLQMDVIDRTTWAGLQPEPRCYDRAARMRPPIDFVYGGTNEIVSIRACAVFDPFFPTTRFGLRLPLDESGGYQMAAMSVFVNEPR